MFGDVDLMVIASAGIADHRESHRAVFQRQAHILRGHRRRRGDQEQNKNKYASHVTSGCLPDRVRNVVDDDVGFRVAKNQVLIDNPVFDLFRKRRQVEQ